MVQVNPFNKLPQQQQFGAQKLQGAGLQRQQQDAGSAGASGQAAALFASKLNGPQAAQKSQAVEGVQNANNNGQQFGLNFPRAAEGNGIKLPALYA